MTPSIRPTVKKTSGKDVQPKVPTRSVTSVNQDDQQRQFREARLARERERFHKLRESRMKNTSAASSVASSSMSITSNVSGPSRPQVATVKRVNSLHDKMKEPTAASTSSLNVGTQHTQLKRRIAVQQQVNKIQTKSRRSSVSGRRSVFKLRVDKAAKCRSRARQIPNVEVKLTRTTQLRFLKADPLFDVSKLGIDKHNRILLPPPQRFVPKRAMVISKPSPELPSEGGAYGNGTNAKSQAHLKKVLFGSPLPTASAEKSSRIPIKKTSFVSPLNKTTVSTPNPSPLRERLSEWLQKREHTLDNFKHLKCFGILGPCVKRPQTPFRKVLPSSSVLKAIPESKESTPNKESLEDSCTEEDRDLNTTFTLEEEDKENVFTDPKEQLNNVIVENHMNFTEADNLKELDQARGVLLELHKLIEMGYPVEQCNLWLRAIRRRFPQCGDEAVYWECLASVEEFRGDLESAVSCYERAISQGAKASVEKSLQEVQKRISELNIETASPKRVTRQHESTLLDSSNIMKSSAIQFEVQEKCNLSSRKNDTFNESCESMFTATPVRRSTRLPTTPKTSTPGITCVRSLNYLEPTVRKSLVFHGNKALEPRD